MHISISEYEIFKRTPHHPALRFGQAWFNYFKLHAHKPQDDTEKALLDRIYNERDRDVADGLIFSNFIDVGN